MSWQLQKRIEAELELRRRREQTASTFTTTYGQDPAGFGIDVLDDKYTEDQVRVLESVRDHPVTIARSANAVGKTFSAARIAVWFYLAWDDAQVYTTAAPPMSNLRRLLWGEIGAIVNDRAELFGGHKLRMMHIERSPKSFITGVAIPASGTAEQREAKFAGKHAPHLLFIVDEGDAVPAEVYQGIESCMSGGHARLLVMFNPRARMGPMWIKERDHLANVIELSAMDHPNVLSGADEIPGAVTQESVVRRINQWSRALTEGETPDDECVETPALLVGKTAFALDGVTEYHPLQAGWRKVTDSALWYMVFGKYPTAGTDQLISLAWINAARARWDIYVAQYGEMPPEGVKPVMGLDVADLGNDENAACFRYGGWVARLRIWGGVDVDMVGVQAKAHYDELEVTKVLVDATGVGAGVAPRMGRLGARAMRVMVASTPTFKTEMGEFYQLRDQLWWSVREWLRKDPGAMLPPDEMLMEELAVPTYAIKSGKVRIMAKDTMRDLLKRSPDRANALGLTFAPQNVPQIWVI